MLRFGLLLWLGGGLGWCGSGQLLRLFGLRRSRAASTRSSSGATAEAELHTATNRRTKLSVLQVTRQQHSILSRQQVRRTTSEQR